MDSGTLTPLLKRLQNAGLIDRKRSTQDERKVLISLTTEGRALRDKALSVPGCIQEKTSMTHDQFGSLLLQFNDLLDRVHQANVQIEKS